MSNCVSELLLNLSETPHFQSGRSSKVQQKNTKKAKFSLQTQSHRAADKFCTWSRCWKKFHLNEMKKCKMTERKVKKEKRRSSLRLKSSVQGLQQAQPNILYLLTLLLRRVRSPFFIHNTFLELLRTAFHRRPASDICVTTAKHFPSASAPATTTKKIRPVKSKHRGDAWTQRPAQLAVQPTLAAPSAPELEGIHLSYVLWFGLTVFQWVKHFVISSLNKVTTQICVRLPVVSMWGKMKEEEEALKTGTNTGTKYDKWWEKWWNMYIIHISCSF